MSQMRCVAYQKVREVRVQRELLVTALQDRKRLAYMRYQGGVDTMLNALNSDQDLFVAELSLAQARLDELLSLVQLYKALGGGWQDELSAVRLCGNTGALIDVMLSPSTKLRINSAKHLAFFSSCYEDEILRLRLRMTLRHSLSGRGIHCGSFVHQALHE